MYNIYKNPIFLYHVGQAGGGKKRSAEQRQAAQLLRRQAAAAQRQAAETTISDPVILQNECEMMQNSHNVIIGKSWGSLPTPQQDLWRRYNCDSLLRERSERSRSGSPSRSPRSFRW